jgi:hypothetical protein
VKLYGYRNGRTARALWALEEVAATYDYVEVDIPRGEGRSEAQPSRKGAGSGGQWVCHHRVSSDLLRRRRQVSRRQVAAQARKPTTGHCAISG